MPFRVRVSSTWFAPRRNGAFAILAAAATAVVLAPHPAAEAKRPGSTYCFHGTCHRVKTLDEMRSLVGKDVMLHASHYGHCKTDRFNPCGLTSSGSVYEPQRPDNAASPIYPDGTRLLVFNPANGAAAMIRINNAGPYWGNRKLDVSRATAQKLGFSGVARLQTRVISAPDRREATYSKHRRYDPVAGYIGRFASIEDAEHALAAVMAVRAMAASAIAPVSGGVIAAAHAEPVTAEQRRRELARKEARRIAKLSPPPLPRQAEPSRMALTSRSQPEAAAAMAPPAPIKSPQHRSRRIAGVAPPPPVMKAKAIVVAARTPVPARSPVVLTAAKAAQEKPRSAAGMKLAAAVPLPELAPARWRMLAASTPPLPEGKPTRIAAAARNDAELDDLAWQIEQVLIERYVTHERADAIGEMDDNPFALDQNERPNSRVLPISNEARAGRMG